MIRKRLDELAQEFALIDQDDVFHYLVDRGEKFTDIPAWANDTNRVPGCVSRLWANIAVADGVVRARTRSDSILVDGTARVVAEIVDGVDPEVARQEMGELDRVPALLGLSSQRRNGLSNLITHIKKALSP